MDGKLPRVSDRPNKGVPPKRFDMDPPGGKNTTVASASPAAAAASVSPAIVASTSTANQQKSSNVPPPITPSAGKSPDLMAVLVGIQREMKQMSAANNNLNTLLITQREQTESSIALLRGQIESISQKIDSAETVENVNSRFLNDNACQVNGNGESLANTSSHNLGPASVKAKIYPLPKFSGLPEEWPIFFEDFQQTTAEFGYNPLQNIIRIRESLNGPARETVENLLSSAKNVEVIVNILGETYGRPEQLIRSQINKVNALPQVPEGKLDLLVHFSTKVINMVRFLQTANGKHHLNNPTLLSELVSKLPPTKQMQWAEKCITLDEPANLLDFCKWLDGVRKIANMVVDGLPSTSSSSPSSSFSCPSSSIRNRKQNKYALTTGVVKQCVICSGNCNLLTDCQGFKNISVNDRWKKARELRLCFSCLKGHHQVGKCFKRQRCGINGCATAGENDNVREVVNLHAGTQMSEIVFQIIPVKLYGPTKSISIYAFIDDGADATMLEWDVGKEIGLEGQREKLKLQWLNGHFSSQETEIVDLKISSSHEGNNKYDISKIYLVKGLELPTQSFSTDNISHLAALPISNYYKVKPQMIISLTHAFLTVPVEIPRCPDENGPIAVRTKLGWVVYGPNGKENTQVVKSVFMARHQCGDANMEQLMNQYFEVESSMVKLDSKPVMSKNDEKALNILKSTTFRDGIFECGLLWKNETRSFPNSYAHALKRLQILENKFMANPKLEHEYRKKMQHLVNKGYARRLSQEEMKIRSSTTFFLPHFAVFNPSKDSLRVVFDAAAKVQGVSLNDYLLPGPDLNQPLIGVLFKFREKPIAVCGDIKEMFLQVATRKDDQDAQRFLYRKDVNQQIEHYVMTRAIFGATCSPTIAQYVKNLNAKKYQNEKPRAAEAIIKRHYVDDYVDCFSEVEEALKTIEDVIQIHKSGGFIMHKIVSNSEQINKYFGNPMINRINIKSDDTEKILGIQWSPVQDEFVFDLQFKRVSTDILENKRIPTKREVLSIIMSVFDPMGFICNFTISGKLLMQSLWKCGLKWDEVIPEAIRNRWNVWIGGLVKVRDFNISRCYFTDFCNEDKTLHIFCDACEMAMATVAYWRLESPEGPKLSFVAGKANCAPTKFISIPRLELQAAVMAVRLKDAIIKHHNIQPVSVCFWTDSSTVVKWLKSEHRRYKQFVANRVAEILETSNENQWRWVPGNMNPADEGTRPIPIYNPESRWKHGPEFLRRPPEFWPTACGTAEETNFYEELRQGRYVLSAHAVNDKIFELKRFSKYRRLQRAIGWVFRYVRNLKFKITQQTLIEGDLSIEEEDHAEKFVIGTLQKSSFREEYKCILSNKSVPVSSEIKSLNPYIDNFNNLRCGGRIDNAPIICFGTKRPLILPKKDLLTHLIVRYYHDRQMHINDKTVICELRQKCWIPSIRVVLKSVKAACCGCKLQKCKPVQPIMGPLPKDRLSAFVRPFSYTGLDYFGPVMVSIRRSHEKRWVALFTCLTTRAVHLELSTNLSSDSCLLCIRNFINRRGVPVQMRSDNGTNFIGIKKELGNEENFIDHEKIDAGLKPLGIKWKFNTPSDPSAGGSWERLVQSVKKALYATLKEQTPRPETLYSLLVECENIVNSRPLTHLPVTPDEPEPLSPNHFLLGCSNSTQTPAPFNPKYCSLRKQWRILQNLKNCLWKRWMLEYLPDLTRRTKWCRPSKPMATGTLVLICETDQPRSKWKRGRVVKLYVGKDGVARSAEVNTVGGSLRRPVSKLAVLDVENCGEVDRIPFRSIHGGGDVANTS